MNVESALRTVRRNRLRRRIATVLMILAGALATGLAVACTAHAAPPPQPLARSGGCPGGYYASGQYCVPSNGARFAVARSGSCPGGYYASGDYCVAATDGSRLAVPRAGSCPGGYYASGDYCVASR